MNVVAAGAILLCMMLLSMALLCCAYAADNPSGRLAAVRSDPFSRANVETIRGRAINRSVKQEESSGLESITYPAVEKNMGGVIESHEDAPDSSVHLKGVRG